jgi:hypothetical protein
MSNILGLVIECGIRTTLWLRRSKKAIGEEDDERIGIVYYVFFILDIFFKCNLGMYCAKI